jgi:hypothetical protein
LKCQGLFPTALAVVIWAAGCANSGAVPAVSANPAVSASPASSAQASAPAADEETGRVSKVGDFGYGLVPDRDPGTRYAPSNLPEAMKKDGLRVAWTGKETEPPEGVRMWGTPYHIDSIRVLE